MLMSKEKSRKLNDNVTGLQTVSAIFDDNGNSDDEYKDWLCKKWKGKHSTYRNPAPKSICCICSEKERKIMLFLGPII